MTRRQPFGCHRSFGKRVRTLPLLSFQSLDSTLAVFNILCHLTGMGAIYKPTLGPDCWREFLADPERQWKTGYSARSMANAWEAYNGLPQTIRNALSSISSNIEPLLVIPEYKVSMPGQGGDSQNDAFLLARLGNQTASIMIEGKVSETFDKEICDWMKNASANKRTRLTSLCVTLGLSFPPDDRLRYQLFHRTASALITAEKFKTDLAIMLVHSFSREHVWFEDYAKFAQALGVKDPERGIAQLTSSKTSVPLFLGWVTGEARFLEM